MSEPPVPQERLSPAVRSLWRLRLLRTAGVALAIGMVLRGPLDGGLEQAAWLVPLVAGAVAVAVVPGLRYRRWRFDVEAEQIDLRHGGLSVRRTLVPMRRVQHVDTDATPLAQLLGLATVTVHTAGGAVAIPGLEATRAWAVQQRIAELARLAADD